MNRTQIIADLFNNTTEGSFDKLSMSAQVSVVYRVLRSTLNNVSYWARRAEENEDNNAEWKRAETMRENYARCLPGQYQFLQRASHYSEGVAQFVEHDTTGRDDYGDVVGGSEWSEVVLNGNPHAWAKRILVDGGMWDESIDFGEDHKLLLPNLSDAADRVAGQLVAKMLIVLGNDELYKPKKIDARDIEIMALSPEALAIAKLKKPEAKLRAAYRLALKHTPFGVTEKEIEDAFDELQQLDEDDELRAEIKRDKREMRRTTNEVIKDAARAELLASTVARLKAAGLSDELIAATVAKIA